MFEFFHLSSYKESWAAFSYEKRVWSLFLCQSLFWYDRNRVSSRAPVRRTTEFWVGEQTPQAAPKEGWHEELTPFKFHLPSPKQLGKQEHCTMQSVTVITAASEVKLVGTGMLQKITPLGFSPETLSSGLQSSIWTKAFVLWLCSWHCSQKEHLFKKIFILLFCRLS